jgi:hypothetical protein
MKKLTPSLKKYKKHKRTNLLNKYRLRSFEDEVNKASNERISEAEATQWRNNYKLVQERAKNTNFLYKVFDNFMFLLPIPFSITVFFFIDVILAFFASLIIYAVIINLITSYQSKVTDKFLKLPEFMNDSNELKLIRIQEKEQVLKEINSFKKNIKLQEVETDKTKRTILDLLKQLREDNWIEFVLSSSFYNSSDWKEIRSITLKNNENKCILCGSRSNLAVDHIKPRSKYPELALDIDNTQILCQSCNSSKGNRY